MATTFVKIQTVTVGSGGAASIDFTSIPQTFTDLKIVLSGRTAEASNQSGTGVYFNSDTTSANYTFRRLYGLAGLNIKTSDSGTGNVGGYISAANNTTSMFGTCVFYIPNYALSSTKSFNSEGSAQSNSTSGMSMTTTLWNNTSAITSIKIFVISVSFVQYSTATLYGIKSS